MEKEMLYTTNEVADMLRVTPLTIRRLASKGKLKACKVGRVLRFRPSDIDVFLNDEQKLDMNKAKKFEQLAGKWAGSRDEVEAIKKAIKESKSQAEF